MGASFDRERLAALLKRDALRTGTFTLAWAPGQAGAISILEEATRPNLSDAVVLYQGPQSRLTLYGRSPGTYYYRVRTAVDGATSDWSNGIGVRVSGASRWQLRAVQDYTPHTLLAVQRALLRLCAARGDLLAVLALLLACSLDLEVVDLSCIVVSPCSEVFGMF